jgi:hypothetical protein
MRAMHGTQSQQKYTAISGDTRRDAALWQLSVVILAIAQAKLLRADSGAESGQPVEQETDRDGRGSDE